MLITDQSPQILSSVQELEVDKVQELISCQNGSNRNLVLEAVESGDITWQGALRGASRLIDKHASLLAEESFQTLESLCENFPESQDAVRDYLSESTLNRKHSGRDLDTALRILCRDEAGLERFVEVVETFDYSDFGSSRIAEELFHFAKKLPESETKARCLLAMLKSCETSMILPDKIFSELSSAGAEYLEVALGALDEPLSQQQINTLSQYFASCHEEAVPHLRDIMENGSTRQKLNVAQTLSFVNCSPESSEILMDEICNILQRIDARPPSKLLLEEIRSALQKEAVAGTGGQLSDDRSAKQAPSFASSLKYIPFVGKFFLSRTTAQVPAPLQHGLSKEEVLSEDETLLLTELCTSLSLVTLRERHITLSGDDAFILDEGNVEYLIEKGFDRLSDLYERLNHVPEHNFSYRIGKGLSEAFENALLEQRSVSGVMKAVERYCEATSTSEKKFMLSLLTEVSHSLSLRIDAVKKRDAGKSDDILPFGRERAAQFYDRESLIDKYECLQTVIPLIAFDIEADPLFADAKLRLANCIKQNREKLSSVALKAFPFAQSYFTQQLVLSILDEDPYSKEQFHNKIKVILATPSEYRAELYEEALRLASREGSWTDEYHELVKAQYHHPASANHRHMAMKCLQKMDPDLTFVQDRAASK